MNTNQELVSFPFRPYLAKYLFYLANNEVIETDEAFYKHLDITMNNPDARFIRVLMQRCGIPGVAVYPMQGFRFTIRIPKQARKHTNYVEDSRTKAVWIDEETANIIQDHFDARFRDCFISFVSGHVQGSGSQRKSLKSGILFFMKVYDLEDETPYNYDQLAKLYERRNSPLKGTIYRPKKEDEDKKPDSDA